MCVCMCVCLVTQCMRLLSDIPTRYHEDYVDTLEPSEARIDHNLSLVHTSSISNTCHKTYKTDMISALRMTLSHPLLLTPFVLFSTSCFLSFFTTTGFLLLLLSPVCHNQYLCDWALEQALSTCLSCKFPSAFR